MEAIMNTVQTQCATQLTRYTQCVHHNTADWERKCGYFKRELAKCSERYIGPLKAIKAECADAIAAYDKCVTQYSTEPAAVPVLCEKVMAALSECTDRAAKRMGTPPSPATGGGDR